MVVAPGEATGPLRVPAPVVDEVDELRMTVWPAEAVRAVVPNLDTQSTNQAFAVTVVTLTLGAPDAVAALLEASIGVVWSTPENEAAKNLRASVFPETVNETV